MPWVHRDDFEAIHVGWLGVPCSAPAQALPGACVPTRFSHIHLFRCGGNQQAARPAGRCVRPRRRTLPRPWGAEDYGRAARWVQRKDLDATRHDAREPRGAVHPGNGEPVGSGEWPRRPGHRQPRIGDVIENASVAQTESAVADMRANADLCRLRVARASERHRSTSRDGNRCQRPAAPPPQARVAPMTKTRGLPTQQSAVQHSDYCASVEALRSRAISGWEYRLKAMTTILSASVVSEPKAVRLQTGRNSGWSHDSD